VFAEPCREVGRSLETDRLLVSIESVVERAKSAFCRTDDDSGVTHVTRDTAG
jgi:hypothetical protein